MKLTSQHDGPEGEVSIDRLGDVCRDPHGGRRDEPLDWLTLIHLRPIPGLVSVPAALWSVGRDHDCLALELLVIKMINKLDYHNRLKLVLYT